MSVTEQTLAAQKKILSDAQSKGPGASLRAYFKLSGPGWLQSAITLGGGSLAVDLDYEVLGAGNGMLMVSASGTAVVLE
jgi:hypothetical protein